MHSFVAILIVALASICCRVQAGVISSDVTEKCKSNPNKKVDVMIALPSVENTLPQLKSNEDIATRLGSALKTRTTVAQEPIIAALKAINPNFDIRTYWIANRISIKGVRCSLFSAIGAIPGVFTIRTPVTAKVGYIAESLKEFTEEESQIALAGGVQWGVEKIGAPEVWPETKGEGIVVGMIDTGARGTHEALRDNFKGENKFGWLDGFTNSSTGLPMDGHGHGSHVMGSICGRLGVGVAPGATWMACSGCDAKGGCEEEPLLTCGQFMFCPYKQDEYGNVEEDCTERPRLVSNSWGALFGPSDFYNEVIANWQLVGIIPVFAIGNSGPLCGTTGSPGNQMNVISVGATDNKDNIASFSSRGPGLSGITKPEVSAPGKNIYSAWFKNDKAYSTISGTSMAAPHVSGAVALLLSRYPNLLFPEVEQAFEQSASQKGSVGFFETCTFGKYPNNAYGYGRIDMPGAFKYAQQQFENNAMATSESTTDTTEGSPTF